jgi:hypothetical protein
MVHCNTTRNYTDADTVIVIGRPRYKTFYTEQVEDGEIIRDIDQWYING